jgi:glycosyltransferase involved in cell wall biosynthesis
MRLPTSESGLGFNHISFGVDDLEAEVAELTSAGALGRNTKLAVTSMPDTKSRSVANFDVGVLFYNRARQTLDCILSFLNDHIQPFIIILDQASAAEQRELLTNALIHQPNVRFITLAKNIGVGPGRNRLSRECSSNWILFVDNDSVLNTPGGVGLISSAVERAQDVDGFSPRILNVHENRFMDRLRITERNQLLRFEVVGPDVPITNMFSGCAVVMRRSFLLNEPYDERYFVGFEDFELALRAFTRRQPMRLRSLDNVTLVHKHMPVISDPDVASTRMRYSSPHIAKSFDVLKTRYNENLFSGWEQWTTKQQEEMIASRRIAPRSIHDKINLTFVVDAPNSTSDNIVRTLDQYITATHVSTTVYTHTIDEPGQTLRLIIESCADVIHFMWRADFRKYVCAAAVKKCAALMRLSEAELLDFLCQSHITFSVGDYLFLDQEEISSFRPLYWLSEGYCVTSPKLFDIYGRISDYPKPSALILDGVDSALFHPGESAERENSSIKIGWVGKSSWDEGATGLRTIIHPSVDTLRLAGVNVELLIVDELEHWREREEIAALYREMDIYVSASYTEDARRTVLEAMASGIPVVSTRVGVVPYVFGPKQQDFIVDRSVEAFSNALHQLCLDIELRRSLAQENLKQIANHWASCAPLWECFFEDVIRKAHPDASNWRRFMIDKFFLSVDEL